MLEVVTGPGDRHTYRSTYSCLRCERLRGGRCAGRGARPGLGSPRDVAVVGFNDPDVASELPTPLTSVHSPLFDMSALSMRVLLALLRSHGVRTRLLQPTPYPRASTVGTSPSRTDADLPRSSEAGDKSPRLAVP